MSCLHLFLSQTYKVMYLPPKFPLFLGLILQQTISVSHDGLLMIATSSNHQTTWLSTPSLKITRPLYSFVCQFRIAMIENWIKKVNSLFSITIKTNRKICNYKNNRRKSQVTKCLLKRYASTVY